MYMVRMVDYTDALLAMHGSTLTTSHQPLRPGDSKVKRILCRASRAWQEANPSRSLQP